MTVRDVEIRPVELDGSLQTYGVGLFNAATQEVTQARQKRKYQLVHRDSEVRVFENRGVMPRAFLVPDARVVSTGQAVLAQMVDGPFDPRTTALLEDPPTGMRLPLSNSATVEASGSGPPATTPPPASTSANIVSYADNSVVIRTSADRDGVLVLTDSFYPGWVADVDGKPTPIVRANYLFRAVVVPAGEHVVTFAFRPWSVAVGAIISLLASTVILVMPVLPAVIVVTRRAWLTMPAGPFPGRARRAAEPMAELP
jgi:hypothetical protein